jgi:hypothetical protein
MSKRDIEYCIGKIPDNLKQHMDSGLITEADISDVVSKIEELAFRKGDKGQEIMQKYYQKIGTMLIQDKLEEITFAMRTELLNQIKLTEVDAALNKWMQNPKAKHKAEALSALMVGDSKLFEGSLQSVGAKASALQKEFFGSFIADLKAAGVEDFAFKKKDANGNPINRKEFDRQVFRELYAMGKEDYPAGGVTGNENAQKLATIIRKHQRKALIAQNEQGAYIKDRPDYIVKQVHDTQKLRGITIKDVTQERRINTIRNSKRKWINFIKPLLDEEATFKDIPEQDINKWLSEVFDNLSTGEHMKHHLADTDAPMPKGKANLAAQISAARKLHFKDADAAFDYHMEYGSGDLMQSVKSTLTSAADNVALMERFGPTPKENFDRIIESLKREARDTNNTALLEAMNGRFGYRLENQFAEIDGSNSIPVDSLYSKLGSGIRLINNLKLGGASISSLTDPIWSSHELRAQGVGFIESYHETLSSYFKGRRSGTQREIAENLGLGLEAMMGSIIARFDITQHPNGGLSKFINNYIKLSGLSYMTDAQKVGAGLMLVRNVAKHSKKSFDALPAGLKRRMKQYGITETRWSVLKDAIRTDEAGRKFVTPEAIRALDNDELFSNLTKQGHKFPEIEGRTDFTPDDIDTAVNKYKETLARDYLTYIHDSVDRAVPSPDARIRAATIGGRKKGTLGGEVIQGFWQFKSFALKATSIIASDWKLKGGGMSASASTIGLMLQLTAMGYGIGVVKDVVKGKTPKEPSWGAFAAGFLQGGGLGLYGDFLFGMTTRYGQTSLQAAAGPSIGMVSDTFDMYTALREGKDISATTVRWFKNHMNPTNLWYTKAAFDYLLFYRLQEAVNPGYLRRMERRIRKENKQKYILPPSKIY